MLPQRSTLTVINKTTGYRPSAPFAQSTFFSNLRPLNRAYLARRRWSPLGRRGALLCKSMVNVDVWSPSLLLGVGLVGSGITLFSIRTSNPSISRDSDVFLSSMIIVTGGALIFQGWRLDPLLLLCQLMTCGVAIAFALETLDLRKQQPADYQPEMAEPRRRIDDTPEDDSFFDEYQTELPSPQRPRYRPLMSDGWTVEGIDDDYDENGVFMGDSSWNRLGAEENVPTRENPEDRTGSRDLQSVEDWE